ncbi:hypothetical protein LUZ60_000843 [Juncus effusus]|nr:hypothetical protein LUZ60_000843 [Juncus effusus]
MENTNYAIEIDGEAICLDGETATTEESTQPTLQFDPQNPKPQPTNSTSTPTATASKIPVFLTSKELSEELLGQVVHSEEEAYKLYCEYGLRMGFSIRKGKQYYFTGTKNIRTKDYYCSKEGSRDDDPDADPTRPDARTNCKAMIRFRVDSQGRWKVIRLVQEHNHELARPGQRHMLRSARSLIMTKPAILERMVSAINPMRFDDSGAGTSSAGIVPVAETEPVSREIVEQELNLEEEIGNIIDPTDAQNVVNYFKRRVIDEGMFHWDVQVNSEGRISNLFFRDGRSRIDYDCFRDVVIFDTSYRSNKYNLICAPFIGVNHHWQNLMFGCAFLLDDSVESYEWLFKSFVDSMGGHAPGSIFTDLNPSVLKAVESVLPHTRHCLAPWHVQKTVDSHIGTLNASQSFQNLFIKCLRECETEMEFNDTWKTILEEYNLQDHDWLTDLYNLRDKWSSILHKDAFDAGITSPEKIETLTNILTNISNESTSLFDLVSSIDKLTASWRAVESEEDMRCSQNGPARAIPLSTLLKHAAEVYTHKAYKLIEADFLDQSNPTSYTERQESHSTYRFQFMNQEKTKMWMVTLDTATLTVNCCSCMKFETVGLLCCHALNAFSLKSIERIPDKYILDRWRKDARRRIYGISREDRTHLDACMAEQAYRNQMMKYIYNLVIKSRGHEESCKLLLDVLESAEHALEDTLEKMSLLPYSSTRSSRDGEKSERKKKKLLKDDKKSKKARKSSHVAAGQDPVFAALSNGTQTDYSGPQDPRASSVGRPIYNQGYSTNEASPGQMFIHPNMNSIPHCSSQDYSSYGGAMRPLPPNFGGARNI